MKVDDPTPPVHSLPNIPSLLARLRESVELLERAFAKMRPLGSLLSMCADCKSIRGEHGDWQPVATYISDHSDTRFSHGLCPACVEKHQGRR